MNTAATTVDVALGDRAYPVHIGAGALARLGEFMAARGLGPRVMVVTNPAVARAWGEPTLSALTSAGLSGSLLTIPPGERSKKLATVERICDAAIAAGLDRRSCLVALGGGVVGDVVGFAAASLFRGVDLVQVPTTLVAMVDSSVGGKTGVNSHHGKNLIGAFWQPKLVVADLACLHTLPPRELRCGMAEVIKHGCILDEAMFERLERELATRAGQTPYRLSSRLTMSEELVAWSVQRSCELKAAVVVGDERESGQRKWLNYGHTFGHALETVCGYGSLHHGEAVSLGMVLAAEVGVRRGDIDRRTAERIAALCVQAGLPVRLPAGADSAAVFEAMHKDKKAVGGKLTLTLLRRLGEAMTASDTPPALIQSVLAEAERESD